VKKKTKYAMDYKWNFELCYIYRLGKKSNDTTVQGLQHKLIVVALVLLHRRNMKGAECTGQDPHSNVVDR
jgi:hypothetical protein